MNINQVNSKLLRTLGLSFIGFLAGGILINFFFPVRSITVLIDRSYCSPEQWVQVAKTYEELYQQHQQKSLRIKEVILYTNLGQESLSSPPLPEKILTLNTYGRLDAQRLQKLQNAYPNAKFLRGQSTSKYNVDYVGESYKQSGTKAVHECSS